MADEPDSQLTPDAAPAASGVAASPDAHGDEDALDPSGTPTVEPRPRRTLRDVPPFQFGFFAVLGGLVAIGLWGILGTLQQVILIVAAALFVALGINPLVEWMIRRKMRRGLSVGIIALLIIAFVGLTAWAVVPLLQSQLMGLFRNAPGYVESLRENDTINKLDQQFGIIDKVTNQLKSGEWVNGLFGGIVGAGRVVANTVFSVVMTVIMTVYFLASLPQIKAFVYQLAPASRRATARRLADGMFDRVGGYLSGMFVDVFLWAICAFVMLNIIGLGQYSVALTFVVIIFAWIPVVGWYCSMAIVALLAFSISPTIGIISMIYFFAFSQLDCYVIQPRIFSKSLEVPPSLIILGALSGGILLGIVGALVAIPVTASLLLVYREVIVPRLDAS